jgi:hypothetical protein
MQLGSKEEIEKSSRNHILVNLIALKGDSDASVSVRTDIG